MKYILLSFIFYSTVWAQECSKINIALIGDVVFFSRDKNDEVKKDIQYNEVPKHWNVNSDRFHHLYIDNNSNRDISHALIEMSSKKVKEFKLDKKINISKLKNEKGYFGLIDITFHKDILPNYIILPTMMKLSLFNNDNFICSEEYLFEVIQ